MQQHSSYGAEIIGDHESDLLKMAKVIALGHHEKWDGSGYPSGLAGGDIPLPARIVAIADVFDALTSERPYHEEYPVEDAVALIKEAAGYHFDPNLVNCFRERLPEILEIKERYAESKGRKPMHCL